MTETLRHLKVVSQFYSGRNMKGKLVSRAQHLNNGTKVICEGRNFWFSTGKKWFRLFADSLKWSNVGVSLWRGSRGRGFMHLGRTMLNLLVKRQAWGMHCLFKRLCQQTCWYKQLKLLAQGISVYGHAQSPNVFLLYNVSQKKKKTLKDHQTHADFGWETQLCVWRRSDVALIDPDS